MKRNCSLWSKRKEIKVLSRNHQESENFCQNYAKFRSHSQNGF